MNRPNQNQRDRDTDPSNVQQTPDHKQKSDIGKGKIHPHGELDKKNIADRSHGRTNDSLGPDHEPGTV